MVDYSEYTTLDKSLIITPPGTVSGNAVFTEGGLGNIRGLRCSGVYAGFRRNPTRNDFCLLVCDEAAVASGLFTTNRFAAAPVFVSREHLQLAKVGEGGAADGQGVRAVLINSGQANAATGQPGHELAAESTRLVAEVVGCQPHQVLIASTGVIGKLPYAEKFKPGIEMAYGQLGSDDGSDLAAGLAAAEAIMTTDTYAKQASLRYTGPDGIEYRVAGMVKGSGMIEPNMATLLGVFATDAALSQQAADAAFKRAIDLSLNRLTVDSDTSTNDTAFFLATGGAGGAEVGLDDPGFAPFVEALTTLAIELARQTAADGEGSSKLITVRVTGAADEADADKAARSVANSPLFKTAVAGHDANWGRIAMALGKSGAVFAQEQVSISLMGLPVLRNGLPVEFSEEEALRLFDELAEIIVEADLGCGDGQATIWTCDLTHGYIAINGDYRS